ncbi:aminopeptidase P family protein [Sporobolomyces koalae]|uniref:aminopeptidase P family protein n=1 Tax=Sporobolomyces koalae TaxID=500713 RepID=UPI00316C0472
MLGRTILRQARHASASNATMNARLSNLRKLLQRHSLDAYLVDSGDQHQSEYLAPCDERRAWISGFTGSAGTAIVHREHALLWTDGRYHQQAAQEISSDWTLFKQGLPDVPSWTEYLSTASHSSKLFPHGSRLGLDPNLLSITEYNSLLPQLERRGIALVPIEQNLVDEIWTDQPARPKEPVFVLDDKYAGESAQSKIDRVRAALSKQDLFKTDSKNSDKKCWGMIVSQLDEIAWLLNLRGNDIPYNPVFFAFLALPTSASSKPTLFIDLDQVPQKVYEYLAKLHLLIEPYDGLNDFCRDLPPKLSKEERVLLPPKSSVATALSLSLDSVSVIPNHLSPITVLKAIKNETELRGFRESHQRDGVALVRYFSWLERQLNDGIELNEYQAGEQLREFRSQLALYKGLSFTTISSTGPNAAIIHYSPDEDESATIDKNQIYLCDSGGQYLDGTTDVTRTLHFGTPTDEEKRCYTRVLQGHIAIDSLVFPDTVTGYQLDAFARAPLWREGLGYNHGTGHGVGSFLHCHEGPHGLGVKIGANDTKFQAGMIISNEPGYYQPGDFGIRIENLVAIVEKDTPNRFGGVKYLGMESLTMCPIATNLIDPELMSPAEVEWINTHNFEVLNKIGALVKETGDEDAFEWLEKSCQPLEL